MNVLTSTDTIAWIAGALQLAVACYALRLNRIFGTTRVGWSLFTAFLLLAVFHFAQSYGLLNMGEHGIKPDAIYAVISLLLLTGMVHIETMTKTRLQLELEEQRIREALEMRVNANTAELLNANAELHNEVSERKRIAAQMEATYKELLTASRQAGMTEVATNVLHNVGNVLNSVNISASLVADHIAASKVANLARVADIVREHQNDLAEFITNDTRGKQLPVYIVQLADLLTEEQNALLKEIGFVKKKVEHIKDIVNMQQNYAKAAGLTEMVMVTDLVEDALQMNVDALARHDVEIIRDFDAEIPPLTVEKHKVLQVLVNLVRNAKYACDESGRKDKRMTVRVTSAQDRIRISVIDNGVGIPPENLTRIFNHGFTTRKDGHGFGLHGGALAAKDMGGSLSAQSDGPGQGAEFTLDLPLDAKRKKNGNTV